MDLEQARFNMIEQQIRTWEVLDQKVLNLVQKIHREDFIPDPYKQLAFADVNIPLAHGEVTMTPKMEARILQCLDIQVDDKILEIGTGCAYFTALLASAGKEVHSIDIYPGFTERAQPLLDAHGLKNVHLYTGDALHGWPDTAPYDVIAVTGSVPSLIIEHQQQLKVGGRLFVITGKSPIMDAALITRMGQEEWPQESLFETDIPPLVGATKKSDFQF